MIHQGKKSEGHPHSGRTTAEGAEVWDQLIRSARIEVRLETCLAEPTHEFGKPTLSSQGRLMYDRSRGEREAWPRALLSANHMALILQVTPRPLVG